jgi:CubicO group peptidase (beta-lactamase class C family)
MSKLFIATLLALAAITFVMAGRAPTASAARKAVAREPAPEPVEDDPPFEPGPAPHPPPGSTPAQKIGAQVLARQGKDWYMGLIVAYETPAGGGVLYFGKTATGATAHAPDAATAFRVASISKTFTATLLALYDRFGDEHVPACPGTDGPQHSTKLQALLDQAAPHKYKLPAPRDQITLEDLATHTSGLPRRAGETVCSTGGDFTATCAPARCPAGSKGKGSCGVKASDCPLSAPRRQYVYSNLGFALLGHGLAAAVPNQGRTWAEVVRGQILSPLLMTRTFTDPTGSEAHAASGVKVVARSYGGAGAATRPIRRRPATPAWPSRGRASSATVTSCSRRAATRTSSIPSSASFPTPAPASS